jgi:trimeric autotransporter adhesin
MDFYGIDCKGTLKLPILDTLPEYNYLIHKGLVVYYDDLAYVGVGDAEGYWLNFNDVTDHTLVGVNHTATGLTTGYVLRATSATTFAFEQLIAEDLPDPIGSDTTGNAETVSTLAQNALDESLPVPFASLVTGKSSLYTDNTLTYNALTNTLTATNVNGLSLNTTNTGITNDTESDTTVFPTWVTANTGQLPQKVTSTKLHFNPSTGILTATGFSGNLSGNVIGNLEGVADNAVLAGTCSTSVIAGNGIIGGGALTENRTITLGTPSVITDSTTNSLNTTSHTHALSITGTLEGDFSGTFTGPLTGNADTATSAITSTNCLREVIAGNGLTGGRELTDDVTITLGTPTTVTESSANVVTGTSHTHAFVLSGSPVAAVIVTPNSENQNFPILFGSLASGEASLLSDSSVLYNPSTNLLTAELNGNSATVTNGVYTSGDQTIGGTKTFSSNIEGDLNGNANTVTNGVYLTGTQTITGEKTFSSTIQGNLNGNATTVTNGVYRVGDQSIGGIKTFDNTIVGSINGNAATVTGGVYTAGNQNIGGAKTFTSNIIGNITGNAATSTVASFANDIWLDAITASSTTMVSNTYYTVTASGRTMTLPASPTEGMKVKIGVLNFVNTIIGRNSTNIMGIAEDITIDMAYSCITLTYRNPTYGWMIS